MMMNQLQNDLDELKNRSLARMGSNRKDDPNWRPAFIRFLQSVQREQDCRPLHGRLWYGTAAALLLVAFCFAGAVLWLIRDTQPIRHSPEMNVLMVNEKKIGFQRDPVVGDDPLYRFDISCVDEDGRSNRIGFSIRPGEELIITGENRRGCIMLIPSEEDELLLDIDLTVEGKTIRKTLLSRS